MGIENELESIKTHNPYFGSIFEVRGHMEYISYTLKARNHVTVTYIDLGHKVNTLDNIPTRLWLPILILDESSPLQTLMKFQKITFLVQSYLELDYYDFTKNEYGPYSKVLYHDICNQFGGSLSKTPIARDDKPAYFTFTITDHNKWVLQLLTNQIDSSKIAKAREITSQYSKLDPCTFLEHVYSKYRVKTYEYEQFSEVVKKAINETAIRLTTYFEGYSGPSSVFLTSILELLTSIVINLKHTFHLTQRFVVLNLLNEILCRCKELLEYYKPHAYLEQPSLEICELEMYLRTYCADKGILPGRTSMRRLEGVIPRKVVE